MANGSPDYRAGMVAQQLEELREALHSLTVSVDKVGLRVTEVEAQMRGINDVASYKRWALPAIATFVVVGLTVLDRLFM